MNKEEIDLYVKECWDSVEEYITGVENGTIIVNKWIKLAVARFKADLKREDLEYKVEAVDKVFKFFYFIRINKSNHYTRFEPLPFQAFMIAALFGFFYKESGKRKHRFAFLFMARKNGKSMFAAVLQLYFLIGDGVEDPQSLLLASSREQASICLEYAQNVIHHSPALSKRLEAQRYKIIFKDRTKGGFSKVLASIAAKLDGYSCSSAIFDEIHSYPNDKLFNVIKSSTGARENPMLFLITTAGFSLTSFCYNYLLYAKNVLNGDITDDALFPMIYSMDEKDDLKDPSNWIKANPALGEINHLDDLLSDYNQSRFSKSQLNNFLTKHLNIFIDQEGAWITNDVLMKVFGLVNEEELKGLDCYMGLDLSATKDLTALVCLFKKEDKYFVIPYFFMANNAENFLRSGGINLKDWIDSGNIILCKTPTIDYDLVAEKFKELKSKFNIKLCSIDPYNSSAIINKLYELQVPTQMFEQRAMRFNEPLKALEKAIYDENILMSNPALKWNINNAIVWKDSNGNIKLMKNKSLDSVDGAVALGMAMGAYQYVNKATSIKGDIWEN